MKRLEYNKMDDIVTIEDFLPKYPNIEKSKYPILNPYTESFNTSIFKKKEFYDNRLQRSEEFSRERGILTKHQKTIARYLSSNTPYDRVLLVHSMGSGKTCSAIGAIEQIRDENSNFTKALILARGSPILDNFMRELVEKCTAGQYIPDNYKKLTDLEKVHRMKKKTKFYRMNTFAKFAKEVKNMSDMQIKLDYSNTIVVIDEVHNLRIQEEKEKETLEMYKQYHRFLHLIENSKVILLSGTPMKDSSLEIASVANLILPLDDQLPQGDQFIEQYMETVDGTLIMRSDRVEEFKRKLKGRVSFLREAHSEVPKRYIGKSDFGKLKHFIVYPSYMSKFQSRSYKKAFDMDHGGKKGVYINSREASLFVYPDGSFGKEGFQKYITERKGASKMIGKKKSNTYVLDKDMVKLLKGETDEDTLNNIREYSTTYSIVLSNILKTNGNCFIYSSLARGSGAILFSLLLELLGYSKATGNEKSKGKRYAVLTNATVSTSDIKRIVNRFNMPDNMNGSYIQVIIGSKAVSEGFSFKNVIFESINTPHWNYSETAQALARGIRLGSHDDLLMAGEKPEVTILQSVAMPEKPKYGKSIDLIMYETSEDKDITIRGILRLLMECAFDCGLNYMRNRVTNGVDGSRECDYVNCNYKCDDINMKIVEEGLGVDELDYSTYNLYYANPKIPQIRKRIEQLFRANIKIDLDSIIKNLKDEYTEDEIRNALYKIEEESESAEFNYRDFMKIYSRSPVKKISNKIEELFKEFFRLNLQTIMEQLTDYNRFEILTALRQIINENIVITNKYGLPCYLREDKNIYFLVNNLTVQANLLSEYYTKNLHIVDSKSFTYIKDQIYKDELPKLVEKICETTNIDELRALMKNLPLNVQELFIESALVAKNKKIKHNKKFRKLLLQYFESYIKNINNTFVSTLLKEGRQILRCNEVDGDITDWHNCDDRYDLLLREQLKEEDQKRRQNNPYGIIGKYNPTNNMFCIVDYKKEEEAKSTRAKTVDDSRLQHSGKVCTRGWKINELFNIAVNRLKIPPPVEYRRNASKKELLSDIRDSKKIMEIYNGPSLKELEVDDLRRILYFGTSKKEGGGIRQIKPICASIQTWLDQNGLLENDIQCGMKAKTKATTGKARAQKSYRLEVYNPHADKRFQNDEGLNENITRLMDECYGVKKYKPPIDKTLWVIIYSMKKIVGFINVNDRNEVINVCIAKNYRRSGIPQEAMKVATRKVCELNGKNISLRVDNREKNSLKMKKLYLTYGFKEERTDDRYTYMIYEC